MYNFSAIKAQALSSSKVTNKLMKFWATFAKQTGVPMDLSGQSWIKLDDILETSVFTESTLISDMFQPQVPSSTVLIDPDLREQYVAITLEDLLGTGENEDLYGLRQFNIIPSRVGTTAYNIMNDGQLILPIELGFVGDDTDNPIIVSGRHRALAIASIFSVIEDWENLEITVKVIKFNSQIALTKYIEYANGSRAMSSGEKVMLWYGEQNLDATDPDVIFEPCKTGLSAFNKACSLYFTIELENDDRIKLQPATLGRIGSSFASKFRSELDKDVRSLLKNVEVARSVGETSVETFVNNFPAFQEMVKVTQTDKDGNQVVSYNFARKYAVVATELAKALAGVYTSKLQERLEEEKAEKEAKKRQSAAKKQVSETNQLKKAMELLRSKGVQVDADVDELVGV